VCGTEFGHNIVIEPPPIPAFTGRVQTGYPRVQRLRVWFGKYGNMALISHLDLLRLFDRALRRASLPIAYTNGFHPSPRLSIASALPLGATSTGEIIDIELKTAIAADEFRTQFAAQLPDQLPLYQVEEIDLKAPSANQLLDQADYEITVATPQPPAPWSTWVAAILAQSEFQYQETPKSRKVRTLNLRDRLFALEGTAVADGTNTAILRYRGSYRADGTVLRPEHVLFMLEQVAQQDFQLQHIHRCQLYLSS
jgi:radical SAM-linked protein